MSQKNMPVGNECGCQAYLDTTHVRTERKLELLKRSRFLPTDVLLKLYFSVVLPSIKYSLILDIINSVERLHCSATRIIFNLPKDMAIRMYWILIIGQQFGWIIRYYKVLSEAYNLEAYKSVSKLGFIRARD